MLLSWAVGYVFKYCKIDCVALLVLIVVSALTDGAGTLFMIYWCVGTGLTGKKQAGIERNQLAFLPKISLLVNAV
jgi:hypothetical protein